MPTPTHEIYSTRADSYQAGRPTYPPHLVEVLARHGIGREATVVDLGAGTGAMSRLLVAGGFRVVGVEPNPFMRRRAESGGAGMVAAVAEALPFADDSIDAVMVGQALHWFDPQPSAASIWRVLRRDRGVLVAAWNERRTASPFERDIETALRRTAHAYQPTATQEDAQTIFERFTCDRSYSTDIYANHQDMDENQLLARFLSTSWAPEPGSAQARVLNQELAATFHRHQRAGHVRLTYHTLVMSTLPGQ